MDNNIGLDVFINLDDLNDLGYSYIPNTNKNITINNDVSIKSLNIGNKDNYFSDCNYTKVVPQDPFSNSHIYAFGLVPGSYQPSGSMNLSRIGHGGSSYMLVADGSQDVYITGNPQTI